LVFHGILWRWGDMICSSSLAGPLQRYCEV
jgi:hypothetical protein